MITEGKHTGKVIDYAMLTTNSGDPYVGIRFDVDEQFHLMWRGGLVHPKSREITIKALKCLGFAGSIKDLANGPESGCIDTEKVVELDVEHELVEGRTYANIKWINEVGGGGFKNKLSAIEAVQKCAGLDLEADFMQAGIKTSTAPRYNPAAAVTPSYEDIPF